MDHERLTQLISSNVTKVNNNETKAILTSYELLFACGPLKIRSIARLMRENSWIKIRPNGPIPEIVGRIVEYFCNPSETPSMASNPINASAPKPVPLQPICLDLTDDNSFEVQDVIVKSFMQHHKKIQSTSSSICSNPLEEGLNISKDDEAKIEPTSWNQLLPVTNTEKELVERLHRKSGFSREKCLVTLRECKGFHDIAFSSLMRKFEEFQEAKLLDSVALTSEHTHISDKKRGREEEAFRLKYTDVVGQGNFQESLLLDMEVGVGAKLKNLVEFKDGDDSSHQKLRDVCITLLVLEKKCLTWYGQASRSYFVTIAKKLKSQGAKSYTFENIKMIVDEIEHLLYSMPTKAGEMPLPFIQALEKEPRHTFRLACDTVDHVDHLQGEIEVVESDMKVKESEIIELC